MEDYIAEARYQRALKEEFLAQNPKAHSVAFINFN